ncbi:hypothetical protein GUITHDRAFT_141085 [Guillardia theta CCMP2712]|uniref:PDZ domain-containing protein n=1 Tax=Guillardia theta (strain CCMP2712) TaxID=905079 RepID=L1J3L7_GUITC|nr:hypothetical protein GUITHDRAFT_141085 [Guillardia theta CCMP2712]EKX42685.1 hypothetical protein GUITHDRAFT_141085 [Guillardia theta CCMP2712]|eukprot:XP_005829665.1 hypothetical protein GUITHDRAFT_141085 [Guillardia theta CCMP2712]
MQATQKVSLPCESAEMDLTAESCGIGVRLKYNEDGVLDGPAAKAGVQAGDKLLKVQERDAKQATGHGHVEASADGISTEEYLQSTTTVVESMRKKIHELKRDLQDTNIALLESQEREKLHIEKLQQSRAQHDCETFGLKNAVEELEMRLRESKIKITALESQLFKDSKDHAVEIYEKDIQIGNLLRQNESLQSEQITELKFEKEKARQAERDCIKNAIALKELGAREEQDELRIKSKYMCLALCDISHELCQLITTTLPFSAQPSALLRVLKRTSRRYSCLILTRWRHRGVTPERSDEEVELQKKSEALEKQNSTLAKHIAICALERRQLEIAVEEQTKRKSPLGLLTEALSSFGI